MCGSADVRLVNCSRDLSMPHRYEEWYTRALMPGVTHISIPDDDTMCNATYQKVCGRSMMQSPSRLQVPAS